MAETVARAVCVSAARVELPAALDLTDAETGAMLRAFFNLTAHWRLNDRESRILLGEPAARTYDRWKSDQFAPSPAP